MCSEKKKQKIGELWYVCIAFNNIRKIDKIENSQNCFLVKQYNKFMISTGASERYQNNNLKVILSYVNYLEKNTYLSSIKTCDSVLSFLETKKKSKDEDRSKMDFHLGSLFS